LTGRAKPETPDEREVLTRTIHETQWLGLKVLGAVKEQADQDVGYVEFAAFYKTNDTTGQLHEKSKFIHENDQWYYLDGLLMDPL
jgi:SEC-C motif-containing protein